jgi:hypothetical protein
MWKTIYHGEKVTLGDTIRYQPSSSNLSYKLKIYKVIKTDQHYFEMIVNADKDEKAENLERRIIKYIDIGYHLGLEVWHEHPPVVNADLMKKSAP